MKNSRLPFYAALCLGVMGGLFVFGPLVRVLNHTSVYVHAHHSHVSHANVLVPGAVVLPVIGIALIYLALFVYHRRLLAACVSTGVSVLIVGYLWVMHPFGPLTMLMTCLTVLYVALIIGGYRQFIVGGNLENVTHYLRPIALIALVGFTYGVMGFYLLGTPLFHADFSLGTSVGMTLNAMTSFSGTIDEPTRASKLFIDSLEGIGLIIFMLLLEVLFRPLRLKVLPHQEDSDRHAAEMLIRATSTSSEDFFKLWPQDKHYFFSQDRQAFVAYKPSGRTMVVLGDPVGSRSSCEQLVAEFTAHCRSLGWFIAVINATDAGRQLFEPYGFGSVFTGNEGVIAVAKFVSETRRDKHFRYVGNKAERDNLSVEEWQHVTDERIATLRAVSDEWLSRGGRREYTFFMGYFNETYLRQSRVFVLLQDGRAVAYINLIPSLYKAHASIDHFRSRGNMSSVGMHFLLMCTLEQLHTEHTKTLNIGLSPLSGVDESSAKLLPKTTLKLIRRFGSSYYSFQGLEQFKNKFRPLWEPRFLLYTGAPVGLIRITNDIERAATYTPGRTNRQLYISTFVGAIILAIGLYFVIG